VLQKVLEASISNRNTTGCSPRTYLGGRVGNWAGRAGFEALLYSIPISSGSKDLMLEPDST